MSTPHLRGIMILYCCIDLRDAVVVRTNWVDHFQLENRDELERGETQQRQNTAQRTRGSNLFGKQFEINGGSCSSLRVIRTGEKQSARRPAGPEKLVLGDAPQRRKKGFTHRGGLGCAVRSPGPSVLQHSRASPVVPTAGEDSTWEGFCRGVPSDAIIVVLLSLLVYTNTTTGMSHVAFSSSSLPSSSQCPEQA